MLDKICLVHPWGCVEGYHLVGAPFACPAFVAQACHALSYDVAQGNLVKVGRFAKDCGHNNAYLLLFFGEFGQIEAVKFWSVFCVEKHSLAFRCIGGEVFFLLMGSPAPLFTIRLLFLFCKQGATLFPGLPRIDRPHLWPP